MTDFPAHVRRRVAELQESAALARREGDDYLVSVLDGELESLTRLAAENHVVLDLDAPATDLRPAI